MIYTGVIISTHKYTLKMSFVINIRSISLLRCDLDNIIRLPYTYLFMEDIILVDMTLSEFFEYLDKSIPSSQYSVAGVESLLEDTPP
jgi:hypothetical protein